MTPSREIALSTNFQFGRVVGELSRKTKKRIVFIASADQAHRHSKSGPYGFNRAAKVYDKLVLNAIRKNKISSVMRFSGKLVDAARPDGLWQMTMLAGTINKLRMRAEVISYSVPTYFGMICAGFQSVG